MSGLMRVDKDAQMKKLFLIPVVMFLLTFAVCAQSGNKDTVELNGNQKVLIVYYTRTGNTKQMADTIQRLTGGDCIELKTVDPYPASYDAILEQARREINSGYKPPLAAITEDINSCDVVFAGYPIWHGTTPPPIVTFLSEYDFSGKTIVPFCTSGSSSGDTSFRNVERLCPQATVLEGLQIRGVSVGSAETVISGWLRRIGVIK
jgi:flavodoxin